MYTRSSGGKLDDAGDIQEKSENETVSCNNPWGRVNLRLRISFKLLEALPQEQEICPCAIRSLAQSESNATLALPRISNAPYISS